MTVIFNNGNPALAPIASPAFQGNVLAPTPVVTDNSTTAATNAFVTNAIQANCHYYRNCYNIQTVATNGGDGTKLVFDDAGNLYWVQMNWTGTTSYLYKMSASGALFTLASVTTSQAEQTDLKIDSANNIYWAVVNNNNNSGSSTASVYKVSSAGVLTTFATQAMSFACLGTSLAFDTSGNLYWAVTSYASSMNYSTTSYVYKITTAGSLTQFASVSTTGGRGTSLAFDTSGNLYWAVMNFTNSAVYNFTSYVYKITPAGTLTTFASQATLGGFGTSLAFDTSGNLYWAVTNYYGNAAGSNWLGTSYIYKLTPAAVQTTFASIATTGGERTELLFDTTGNLCWSIANTTNNTNFAQTCYVYKVTPLGALTTVMSQPTNGGVGGALAFDALGNLFWTTSNWYNGSVYTLNSYLHCSYLHSSF